MIKLMSANKNIPKFCLDIIFIFYSLFIYKLCVRFSQSLGMCLMEYKIMNNVMSEKTEIKIKEPKNVPLSINSHPYKDRNRRRRTAKYLPPRDGALCWYISLIFFLFLLHLYCVTLVHFFSNGQKTCWCLVFYFSTSCL